MSNGSIYISINGWYSSITKILNKVGRIFNVSTIVTKKRHLKFRKIKHYKHV